MVEDSQEPVDRPLSDVLDRLEAAIEGESVSVEEIVDRLGQRSFPAIILVPALIAVSPASGIPGLTTLVGLIVALTAGQMLWGRRSVWLPGFVTRRRIGSARLCRAIVGLRRPLALLERGLRPRLTVLMRRPLLYLPLLVMLAISVTMPLLEIIPTSGSVAAAAIACFAAGLLTRDGLLVLLALLLAAGAPLLIWQLAS